MHPTEARAATDLNTREDLGKMSDRYLTDQQQLLADLARQGSENRKETTVVVSPGTGTRVWPVKIKALVFRNVYSVRAVVIGDAGSIPAEMGELIEATNLAESYLSEGTLSVGTFAIMFRAGQKNVFYAVP